MEDVNKIIKGNITLHILCMLENFIFKNSFFKSKKLWELKKPNFINYNAKKLIILKFIKKLFFLNL